MLCCSFPKMLIFNPSRCGESIINFTFLKCALIYLWRSFITWVNAGVYRARILTATPVVVGRVFECLPVPFLKQSSTPTKWLSSGWLSICISLKRTGSFRTNLMSGEKVLWMLIWKFLIFCSMSKLICINSYESNSTRLTTLYSTSKKIGLKLFNQSYLETCL
jgi:hypothetical protein